jgi:hypothetical protein
MAQPDTQSTPSTVPHIPATPQTPTLQADSVPSPAICIPSPVPRTPEQLPHVSVASPGRSGSHIPTPRSLRTAPNGASTPRGPTSKESSGSLISSSRHASLTRSSPSPGGGLPPWIPVKGGNSGHKIICVQERTPPHAARLRDPSRQLPAAGRAVYRPAEGYPEPEQGPEEQMPRKLQPKRPPPPEPHLPSQPHSTTQDAEETHIPSLQGREELATRKRRPLTHRSPDNIWRLHESHKNQSARLSGTPKARAAVDTGASGLLSILERPGLERRGRGTQGIGEIRTRSDQSHPSHNPTPNQPGINSFVLILGVELGFNLLHSCHLGFLCWASAKNAYQLQAREGSVERGPPTIAGGSGGEQRQ